MRKKIAGIALAATAATGIGVGLATPPALAKHADPAEHVERAEARIESGLQDGSITEERAAELRARIAERAAAHEAKSAAITEQRQELADQLGLSVDELKTSLQAGASIADLAAEAGVDLNVIIDSLVAEATAKIEQAVAAERIDGDQAAERIDSLSERITARVNGGRSERIDRGNRGEGHGRFGRGNRGEGHGRFGRGNRGEGHGRFGRGLGARIGALPADITVDELADRLAERVGDRELPEGVTFEDIADRLLERRDRRAATGGGS